MLWNSATPLGGERVDFVYTGHMWCTKPGAAPELLKGSIAG